ncbi:prephenate dehydrogenase [Segetibacter aerophilus]|uniref:Prephenate dehydrogenase n=1 Tax=Segetibacter aerophilus TaxID=670293 RepID=A0A512BFV8_9BACT|nr:prephenate dehydrogenase [Segetibacter aerophilus]GEO10851.1 prephenate dehydrogenase [Segetibacter aerophilus]
MISTEKHINKVDTDKTVSLLTVTIIGTGLIGGSLGLVLKDRGLAKHVIAVDNKPENQQRALELGIADEVLPIKEAIAKSDLIVLAVPVDALHSLLPAILDEVQDQVVMDMGSTKESAIGLVADHPKRGRYVATHPMWGTEYSGPAAAVKTAFADKATVICDAENSDEDALRMVQEMYTAIGMHLIYMNATAHDLHAAYVSHISHITSFALANTVLEKEKEDEAIFELASGGFESTVRLAKSNPAMWVPIFKQNRENVLDVLNEHITQLRKFKSCLEKENYEYLQELIENANGIRRILK